MRELCQDLGSPAVSRYRQRHNMEMFASTAKLCGWQKWGLEDFGHKKWSCLRQCVCSGALCGVILPHEPEQAVHNAWASSGKQSVSQRRIMKTSIPQSPLILILSPVTKWGRGRGWALLCRLRLCVWDTCKLILNILPAGNHNWSKYLSEMNTIMKIYEASQKTTRLRITLRA